MAMKTCQCKILASFSKNKMTAIANCLKIIKVLEIFQLVSSNLHKNYMARKASLIVILA